MNNKSLREIGSEASRYYSDHENRAALLTQAKKSSSPEWTELEDQAYNANIQEAASFASENASQLHDLAVIEAHLGGTAIKVEQPVSIGETVEVRRS